MVAVGVHGDRATGCNQDMGLTHTSLDPDAALREQRIEVECRIISARDALDAALDGLAGLDDLAAAARAKAAPVVERRSLGLADAAKALDVGMTTLNGLIRSGELASYMQGSRRKVRTDEIDAYLDRVAQGQRAAS